MTRDPLADLPALSPDPAVDERIRDAARAELAAPRPTRAGIWRRTLEPLAAASLGLAYVGYALSMILAGYGS